MVFQSYALYPHMTVAENLSFSLKLRGSRVPRSSAACVSPRGAGSLRTSCSGRPTAALGRTAPARRTGRALVLIEGVPAR